MSTTEIAPPTSLAAIGADSAGLRMTPEEFDAIEEYDELYRYELVDGVLVVSEVLPESVAAANELLGYHLFLYRKTHADGAALDASLQRRWIYLNNSRRLVHRVIWAGRGRRPNPRSDAPTIAVDFVSSGTRAWRGDYIARRDEYLAAGVKEYWIIDRFDRKMTVYRVNDKPTIEEAEVSEDQNYTTSLLPGFELPLAELLAAADKWEE